MGHPNTMFQMMTKLTSSRLALVTLILAFLATSVDATKICDKCGSTCSAPGLGRGVSSCANCNKSKPKESSDNSSHNSASQPCYGSDDGVVYRRRLTRLSERQLDALTDW